jgi:uncharacterized RDD family membrane protein YckC
MASWYFVKDGERTGPVERAELDARIAAGEVDGGTLVWRVGLSAWTRACLVDELAVPPPLPSATPPPLPVAETEEAENGGEAGGSDAGGGRAAAAVPRFAGFWVRFLAKLIDGVLLYGIALLVERAVVGTVFNGVFPAPQDWEAFLRLLVWTAPINTLIAVGYTAYFMARHEATPGKRLLGLRVVRANGGRVGTARVVGRYFAETLSTIIFFAGYVMAAFDDEKRSLHDYLCDTRVVIGERETEADDQPSPKTERPAAGG